MSTFNCREVTSAPAARNLPAYLLPAASPLQKTSRVYSEVVPRLQIRKEGRTLVRHSHRLCQKQKPPRQHRIRIRHPIREMSKCECHEGDGHTSRSRSFRFLFFSFFFSFASALSTMSTCFSFVFSSSACFCLACETPRASPNASSVVFSS